MLRLAYGQKRKHRRICRMVRRRHTTACKSPGYFIGIRRRARRARNGKTAIGTHGGNLGLLQSIRLFRVSQTPAHRNATLKTHPKKEIRRGVFHSTPQRKRPQIPVFGNRNSAFCALSALFGILCGNCGNIARSCHTLPSAHCRTTVVQTLRMKRRPHLIRAHRYSRRRLYRRLFLSMRNPYSRLHSGRHGFRRRRRAGIRAAFFL